MRFMGVHDDQNQRIVPIVDFIPPEEMKNEIKNRILKQKRM